MIQCPECGKDIADESAHCGFCGAKIETGAGKKTMMGFAAVSGDELREAAAQARQAREAADAAEAAAADAPPESTPSTPQASSLPARPQTSRTPAEDGRPKLPQIPRPSAPSDASRTPAPPQLNKLNVQGGESGPDSDAPTAVMPAVGDAPSTIDEQAIADTDPDTPRAPKTEPIAPQAAETLPERIAPQIGADGPTEFGTGPAADGPTEFGGPLELGQNTLPEKKKNPALIAVGAIAVMMFMCCAAWIAYGVIYPIIMSM